MEVRGVLGGVCFGSTGYGVERLQYAMSSVHGALALSKAGVPYFPIYNLRHEFCTRLSWVAPDAVVQRAMLHSSPETKRHYQLGMVNLVREGIEQANKRTYQGKQKVLRSYYGKATSEKGAVRTSVSG